MQQHPSESGQGHENGDHQQPSPPTHLPHCDKWQQVLCPQQMTHLMCQLVQFLWDLHGILQMAVFGHQQKQEMKEMQLVQEVQVQAVQVGVR